MAFEYRIIHSANSSTFESIVLCGILSRSIARDFCQAMLNMFKVRYKVVC